MLQRIFRRLRLACALITVGICVLALAVPVSSATEKSHKNGDESSRSKGALPIYQPKVEFSTVYFFHPAKKPALMYNHDLDIVKYRGRFFAAWNANATPAEDVPGQYNFLSTSDDFQHWSTPVRLFYAEGGCENPVPTDNQWQPIFINYKNERLFCAWCDYNARKTYVASSTDGLRWRNQEVPTAPPELTGQVVGFPTNHGLLTRRGVLMFPCSLPMAEKKCLVGHTRYAGVLLSSDGGKSWTWSSPIEALPWSKIGEKPAEFGSDLVTIWEPMLFEQADGKIGLLIRNSTAQEDAKIPEKPHRMLLYATSSDHGHTWTKARTVEVDTICSRNFTVSGVGGPDGLVMVMNDNHVRVPERISRDRYFLALYCSPVCDPDLLLPGPVIQPAGGTAYYPNGFVDGDKLYVGYTYPRGMHASTVSPLPDYSRPFLLPRGGRSGLRIDDHFAVLQQKQSTLGLVLTEALTRKPNLRLRFELNVERYNGQPFPLLSVGGKTRGGTQLRVMYDKDRQADVFQLRLPRNQWQDVGRCELGKWSRFEFELRPGDVSITVDGGSPQTFPLSLLRKIAFGGLYEPPQWPQGMQWASDIRLKLDSIAVE